MDTQAFNLREPGRVYFDHNAATPIAAHLPPKILSFMEAWGNPSSIHHTGRRPKLLLRDSRKDVAEMLGCSPLELVFTSGGSESNNAAIKGYLASAPLERRVVLRSSVEHPSVTKCMESLSGYTVKVIPVSREGLIDLEAYKKLLTPEVALVSVMFANNEFGGVFPIREMAQLAHSVGALFHTDAVQALGKLSFNLHELDVDFASFSAHKFYSLRGAGALYIKSGAPFKSQILGGGQERHRRAGTENVVAIAAFGEMAKLRDQVSVQYERIQKLRNHFEKKVSEVISGIHINALNTQRLPNTSSLLIENCDGESLLMNLDVEGFSVSTGAACSSGSPEPSPVLLALGLTRMEAQSSLRVSLGWGSTVEEVDRFIEVLDRVVARLRAIRTKYQQEEKA